MIVGDVDCSKIPSTNGNKLLSRWAVSGSSSLKITLATILLVLLRILIILLSLLPVVVVIL